MRALRTLQEMKCHRISARTHRPALSPGRRRELAFSLDLMPACVILSSLPDIFRVESVWWWRSWVELRYPSCKLQIAFLRSFRGQ